MRTIFFGEDKLETLKQFLYKLKPEVDR